MQQNNMKRQNALRRIPLPLLMVATIIILSLGVLIFAFLYSGGGANILLTNDTAHSSTTPTNTSSTDASAANEPFEQSLAETFIGPTPEPTPTPVPTVSKDGRLLPYFENGLWGYKNKNGEIAILAQFNGTDEKQGALEFENDVAFAMYNGLYGLINMDGGWLVPPTWSSVRSFSEDKAAVCSGGSWGYINPSGELVINYSFESANDFHCGRACVLSNGYYGYIDINGSIVISPIWKKANDFSNDVAFVTSQSGNNYIIDKLGEKIATLGSHLSGTIYSENFAVMNEGSSFFYYNSYAKGAFKSTYEAAKAFSGDFAAVKLDGLWGFIDTRGVLVIANQFSDVCSFSNGYAAVCDASTNLWGYIDSEGFMTLSPQFDEACDFKDGVAIVRIGNTHYITKSSGERIILY